MYDKRIVWVIGVVSLCCLPGSLVLAQSERLQMHIAGTHAVELSELFRIGSLDGPGDAFGQITGVALGRTNRLYVADDLNHDVRVFDFEGQLVRVIGRQGDGPGEFQSPWTIALDDTDSLIVWDQKLARFSIFDPEGAFHRSFAPPRSWLVNSMRFLPEGDLLVAAFGSTDNWGLHRLGRDGQLIDEFGTVSVDSTIYPGFVSSLFGGAVDVTDVGDIVYTRKSPYELLFFDADGEHVQTCVGSEDWTTAPHDVVEQHADGIELHWEQFVHSSGVFTLEGGRYLNLVIDRPNNRTILDIVAPDCRLLCRHALEEMLVVKAVQENYLVATVQTDVPQVIVFEISVHKQR